MAIAEVSRELESSVSVYTNYTTLEDYPAAREKGRELIAMWHKTILLEYAGRALNLSISDLSFECVWNSSAAFSRASANMSLDLLTYGFYGWKQNATAELSLQVLQLKENGEQITFCICLQKEKGLHATDLSPSFIKMFYKDSLGTFYEADSSAIDITYLGSGTYNVSFVAPDISTPPCIKMILRDPRGIVVAALPEAGVILGEEDDTMGPITSGVLADPNPCIQESLAKLNATVDDLACGASNIVSAEYFVDTIGASGTGASMSASDGYFDFPREHVEAQLDVSSWTLDNHTIYVHGRDAAGNWGNFSSTVLSVIGSLPAMHIHRIDMGTERDWGRWGWWIRGVAKVRVVDSKWKNVQGANVSGHWSGSVSGSAYAWTDTNGKATFKSDWISIFEWTFGGSFTFTVDNIAKDGWIYDPSANRETSDTIP